MTFAELKHVIELTESHSKVNDVCFGLGDAYE